MLWIAFLMAILQEPEEPNSVGMKLVRIPAGDFTRGEGERPPRSKEEWQARDWDESPAHRVRISRAFLIGTTEVTNDQFRRFEPARKGPDAEPVVQVSWDQAVAFCDWLSKKEGRPYRLPTEAEWEYACRAGGPPMPVDVKDTKPRPAGNRAANPWGLHDMLGNVAEWCLDWHGPYDAAEQTDPVGRSEGYARVVRGGSFLSKTRPARAANRAGHLPDDANRATGFRVVCGERPATNPLPVPQVPPAPLGRAPWIPKDSWGPVFSAWNHYAAIVACPNGDMLAAWYTTIDEAGQELAQTSSRRRAGGWEEARLFFDVPDVNDHAPVLLSDGTRIFHFFTQSLRGWDEAADGVRTSDDGGATWSKPRIIVAREARLSQPSSAFATKDGTIILACDGDGHREERLVVSRDAGATWKIAGGDLRKALGGVYAIHPAIAPGAEGSVLAFLRGPDPLPLLVSKDLGETWEVRGTPFPGIGVGQKAAALRLAGGALLLLSHDSKKTVVGGGVFVALSPDDGQTWPHVRKVGGVTGYLAVAQGADGLIHAAGSNLGVTSFTEAWIRELK